MIMYLIIANDMANSKVQKALGPETVCSPMGNYMLDMLEKKCFG